MKETYKLINDGWLYQSNAVSDTIKYDAEYVSYYDTLPKNREMSLLRFKYVSSFVKFGSVLDIGYGNGDFLKICIENGKKAYGNDVSGVEPPSGAIHTSCQKPVDLVTMFDCLEHFTNEDLNVFLGSLNCRYIAITVPWCHSTNDMQSFEVWKHRKPYEHYHHFSDVGLVGLLQKSGYYVFDISSVEDQIRVGETSLPNTLTVLAEKIY